jgi:hypothetical protein
VSPSPFQNTDNFHITNLNIRFIDFDTYQMSFFTATVKSSALSLGFNTADALYLTETLETLFNRRCSPPTAVPGIDAPPELQSICIAANYPLDPKANCSAYPDDGVAKIPINVTATTGTSSSSSVTMSPTSMPNGTVAAGQGVVGKEIFDLPLLIVAVGSFAFALSPL